MQSKHHRTNQGVSGFLWVSRVVSGCLKVSQSVLAHCAIHALSTPQGNKGKNDKRDLFLLSA